ncbi:MAG TPA: MFS transporter [Anaeromyxobacter sp.]
MSALPRLARPPAPCPPERPPSGRRPRRLAPDALRRSLRVSTAEGIAAEVVGACASGAALTGWALQLGCGPALIGLLGALPYVAHLLQLPAARLVERFGPRRVALWSIAIARQAFLPLVLLPFLPGLPPGVARALLVSAAIVHSGLGIVCNNGWVAWMGELVPARVRGRYFGRRTAACTAAGAAAALAAGTLLDRAPGALALAALALVACLAGAASVALMARQAGGRPRPRAPGPRPSFVAVLRVPAARRYLAFVVVSGAGAGLIVPFSGLYVLRDRALGFTFLTGYGAVSAAARAATARGWGSVLDRTRGARAVAAGSTALLAASPLLWIAAASGGPAILGVEAVTGGIASAGAGVAGLALPLALAPAAERPAWLAVFAIAGGLAFGAGTAIAAPLGGLLPRAAAIAGPLTAPFAASAALRLAAAGLALRLVSPRAGGAT